MLRFLQVTLCTLAIIHQSNAQNTDQGGAIQKHLQKLVHEKILTTSDIDEYRVKDSYLDSKSGIHYYYIQQLFDNIPVDHAINTVFISDKKVTTGSANRFVKNIHKLVVVPAVIIDPVTSLEKAAIDLGYHDQASLRSIIPTRSNMAYTASFAENVIEVNKVYIKKQDSFVLAYELNIDEKGKQDYWNFKIDVASGKVLEKNNFTIYCHPGSTMEHSTKKSTVLPVEDQPINYSSSPAYRVYPLPFINPNESSSTVVLDPKLSVASPFGWHDTDGMEGPEFTITRGNNVHSYADKEGNNVSDNNEPDGGSELHFDFAHSVNLDPEFSEDAAIVNAFYVCNMAHDLSYMYGFREESGNYQENNYGNGGQEGDVVRVENMDGSGRNNANFTINSDGNPGRLQSFLFDKIRSLITVTSPEALTGNDFESAEASFGPRIRNTPLSGEIVLALDGNNDNPNLGCQSIDNIVNGKIAMVDRGTCDFVDKIINVQQAGAIMAIVCNIPGINGGDGEDIFPMGASGSTSGINIPSVMMKKSDCDLIKIALNTGQTVQILAEEKPITGPASYDASFDNGILLHEYVHGISTRLTGGPSSPGCLNNITESNGDQQGEQMGEGWSDFLSLVWTAKTGDQGTDARGMGNYVLGESTDDKGIRSFPYSVDRNINPLTYDDIKVASVPHGVGTVWATMLWDMYWSFVDAYGFDQTFLVESSGNFKATYLVMEAMKIQPCRPGFVDGRNAILEADRILYNGENETLIWQVFANRGLGFYADQGESMDHRDGKEDFSLPPFITKEIMVNISSTNNVNPGELIDVLVEYKNYKDETQSDVSVSVDIPSGLIYLEGSGNVTPDIQNGSLLFNVGSLNPLEEGVINFQFVASEIIISERMYYEDVESGDNGWMVEQRKGNNLWEITNQKSLSGSNSWSVAEKGLSENLQRLISPPILVGGDRPVFRFWHFYNMREAINGGFLEITEDGGESWELLDSKLIIRNKYTGELPYLSFGIPGLQGFSGNLDQDVFIDSYIDLSEYKKKTIQLRFRFSQQPGFSTSGNNAGWFLDDFEMLDIKTYSTFACISSLEDQNAYCSNLKEIVVNTETTTNVTTPDVRTTQFDIFPNPADKQLMIRFRDEIDNGDLMILDVSGNIVEQKKLNAFTRWESIQTHHLPSGTYFIRIANQNKFASQPFQVVH